MLLLRSAFWLILAFVVMRPHMDFGSAASALKDEAVQHGRQIAAQSAAQIECTSLTCLGGKAVLIAAATGDTAEQRAGVPAAQPADVPLPRRRPQR